MRDDEPSAQITTPLGSVRFFGTNLAEFLLVMILCIVSVGAYMAYDLRDEIRTANRLNKRMLQSVRLQNCLATLPVDKRQDWLEWCRMRIQENGGY